MKAVTMKDIARALGVSVVSVSKALAGQSGVGQPLREQVLRKARELGYLYAGIPADSAKPQGNVGILVAERFFMDDSFYANLYKVVVMACAEAGVACLLEIITPESEHGLTPPNILAAKKCEGVIVIGELQAEYVRRVTACGVPYILLDFYSDAADYDCVISDGQSGAFQLTRHLIRLGYRRIGYVGSVLSTSSILDRYIGYYKALITKGLSPRDEWILPDRDADGLLVDVALPAEMPDAFVCNCDEVAYRFGLSLKRADYRIPEDVAIVGFDDFRFATLSAPQLTTYHINITTMGKVAVSRLLRKMARQNDTPGRSVISGEIVLRQSTPASPIC